MLLIIIPKGMEYVREIKNNIPYDYFIRRAKDSGISERVLIPDIAKVACQHRNKRVNFMAIDILGITCKVYFKQLRYPTNDFGQPVLYYWQKNNGTQPASCIEKGFFGENRKANPAAQTCYGSFWYQNLELSEEQLAKVKAHQLQQRHNRRKDGDCPKPN